MRYVVLDTETTGLNVDDGHRVIEIGCVEIENRSLTGREYHQKINPVREVDKGAEEIHGMNAAQLKIYPKFEGIVEEFIEFIEGTSLIIHNAEFDKGFLDAELDESSTIIHFFGLIVCLARDFPRFSISGKSSRVTVMTTPMTSRTVFLSQSNYL